MKKKSTRKIFYFRISIIIVLVFLISFQSKNVIAGTAKIFQSEFYVSVSGNSSGDGSLSNPWDLQTALNQPPTVTAGSIIWLAGGTYKGTFTSNLTGSSELPIIVKPQEGARVIIDGSKAGETIKNVPVLLINGSDTWYVGLEITNSDPERAITQSGSNPPERRGPGLSLFGARLKIINCLIYDTGEGIDAWTPVTDGEFYGNIIFNNGWYAPDSHHGHGIYTQNNTGTKKFINNIILDNFGYGWQVYGSENASLKNYYLEGNLVFNDRWLVGGFAPLNNIDINANFTYKDTIQLGYANNVLNSGLKVRNNYFASLIKVYYWNDCDIKSNTLFAGTTFNYPVLLDFNGPPDLTNFRFDSNTYHWSTPPPVSQAEVGIGWENSTLPENDANQHGQYLLSDWKAMGQDLHATVEYFPLNGQANYQLDESKIFIRKNLYESQKTNIIIYNWEQRSEVAVDVSGILNTGDQYELHNVSDYFGDVLRGNYNGGEFLVPMTGHSIAYPLGFGELLGHNTFPEFGAFVLIKTNQNAPLPVKFNEFSVNESNGQVFLNWITSEEQNVWKYIIERSADGVQFETLAMVTPKTSAPTNKYEYIDWKPLTGKSYYRIREVDLSGKLTYSQIESVYLIASLPSFTISPNPVGKFLKVLIQATGEKRIEFKITDETGRVFATGVCPSLSRNFDVNLKGMKNGVYYLILFCGKEVIARPFIKLE